MKNKIKGYAVLTTAALASLLLTGCNEAKKIDKYLADGDFTEALDFYDGKHLSAKEEGLLKEKLLKRLSDTLDAYAKGEVKYKTAQKLVDTILKMDIDAISDESAAAVTSLATLYTSKTSFAEAKEKYESGAKLAAYKLYAQVIEADCDYETARSKMSAIENEYVADLSSQAEELVKSGNYLSACKLIRDAFDESGMKSLEEELTKVLDLSRQNVFDKADRFIENNDFYNATNAVNHVLNYECWRQDDIDAFTKKLTSITEAETAYRYKEAKANIIVNIDYYRTNKDYKNAYAVLNEFVSTFNTISDSDAEFQTYVKGLDDEYYAFVKETADKYKAEGLNAGLEELRDSMLSGSVTGRFESEFSDVIKEREPFLTSCKIVDQKNVNILTVDKDPVILSDETMALPCKSRFLMQASAEDSWSSAETATITFMLKKDYTTLEGSVDTTDAAIVKTTDAETGEEVVSSDETGKLEFFGDDGSLLLSVDLNGADKDKKIAVDITGVESLTIQFSVSSGAMGAFLKEFVLTKDLIS